MPFFLTLFAFLTPSLAADAPLLAYSYVYAGKPVIAHVGETKDGVKVNDVCLKNLDKCKALQTYAGKSSVDKIKSAKDSNFSGAYCEILGGTQLYMHEKETGPAAQFCAFPDQTLIDAKALYRAHAQKSAPGKS